MNRSGVRKVLSAVLSYGVVGLVMWLLYRTVGSSDEVSNAIDSISLAQVLIVSGLGLVYLASMFRPMVYTRPCAKPAWPAQHRLHSPTPSPKAGPSQQV
jgi:hypothetical protein